MFLRSVDKTYARKNIQGTSIHKTNYGNHKKNQPANFLNAMASGGGQNEYIWIEWTK